MRFFERIGEEFDILIFKYLFEFSNTHYDSQCINLEHFFSEWDCKKAELLAKKYPTCIDFVLKFSKINICCHKYLSWDKVESLIKKDKFFFDSCFSEFCNRLIECKQMNILKMTIKNLGRIDIGLNVFLYLMKNGEEDFIKECVSWDQRFFYNCFYVPERVFSYLFKSRDVNDDEENVEIQIENNEK